MTALFIHFDKKELYQHTSYFMLNGVEFAALPSSIEAVLCKTEPGSMEALVCLYTELSLLYGHTWGLQAKVKPLAIEMCTMVKRLLFSKELQLNENVVSEK